jgi:hypothetical protein
MIDLAAREERFIYSCRMIIFDCREEEPFGGKEEARYCSF